MMKIVPLEGKHLRKFVPRHYERYTLSQNEVQLFHVLERISLGPAYTMLIDGEIIAMGGMIPLWGKVADAWLITTPGLERHGSIAARAIRAKWHELMDEMGLDRVQTSAPVSHPSAHRWLKWLGFQKEGVARKFTVIGEDAIIYAKVR